MLISVILAFSRLPLNEKTFLFPLSLADQKNIFLIKDFLLHFLLFGFQGASVRPCFHTDSSILCLPACLRLVGQSGLEPPTSRLSVVCSSQLSYWPGSSQTPLGLPFGGDEEVRTPDLLRARQALSQLSYTP